MPRGETNSDGGEGGARRAFLGHRPERIVSTVAVAVALGAFGGLATVAYIRVLEWSTARLWTSLPDALGVDAERWTFIVPVVLVGAVLLGLARRHLGEYPVSLERAFEDHQRTGEFDRHHIGEAAFISLLSLVFGAALGPEAGLIAVLGGISSWVARVIDANTAESGDVAFVGIGGAMGALFGSAGAAALTLDPRSSDAADARTGRLWRLLPALGAAWAGLWIFRTLGPSAHYFDLGLPGYDFRGADLGWAVVVAMVAAGAGLAFLVVEHRVERAFASFAERPMLTSLIGGLGLAVLASWSSLVLFSGHEGVDALINEYGTDAVRFLVLIAAAKMGAAALLLGTGWKGGRFFPVMFAGAAIGLALSQGFTGMHEVPALAAGMTAVIGTMLRRPLATAPFMVLFFPPAAWPAVVLAALIGSVVGRRLGSRLSVD